MAVTITLYTFPVSHFAEKVRWMLDYSGIAYRVVNWVPLVHAPAAYIKSGKRTVPFVEISSGASRFVVHDSTAIINWIHRHFEPLDLMPDDEAQCREAMAFEDRADSIGDDVIRYMYAPMVDRPDTFIDIWGWGAKPMHRRFLRTGLPIVRSLLANHLDFTMPAREAGLTRLHDVFGEVDRLLADGRAFLVGDQLSIADISIASLLAPIYTPELHVVYSSETFQHTLTEQRAQFTHHASFEWMQQLYARYRKQVSTTEPVYVA